MNNEIRYGDNDDANDMTVELKEREKLLSIYMPY